MNSLGKDSAVCLEWLCTFARPESVTSLHFGFMAPGPDDERYLAYQKRRYPHVRFITAPNVWELNYLAQGVFQYPLRVLSEFNKWDYYHFDVEKLIEEIRTEEGCDYCCIGMSMYESVARATIFHRKGLLQGTKIFPIGLMKKEQVIGVIKSSGMKLNPSYKYSQSTLDRPSYYKMRAAFLTSPEYKKRVMALFPLLRLDEYRYERLIK